MSQNGRRVVAIIPARGGSKGIHRKNLVRLGGRPLLVHSIEQAIAEPLIDEVVVSTDDQTIAECARGHGAEVVDRPAEFASDTATSESALIHALDSLLEAGDSDSDPDVVVFLQATSPLRRSDEIERALTAFDAEGADSLFSACVSHGFVWRLHEGRLEALTYNPLDRPRRQDIGEDLIENGSIYIFKPWVLRELGNRLGGTIAVHRMNALDSFQIDEPEDLPIFERLLTVSARSKPPSLADIHLLVLDFDGVMTDNRVLVHENGDELVQCDRGDGMGLARLRKETEVEVVVLSTEKNPVVAARCRKLDILCTQGCDDKLPQLQSLVSSRGLSAAQTAFVGNDVNDLEAMNWSGIGIAVADAVSAVLSVADYVTHGRGGRGAVREVCELILESKKR